MTIPCLNGKGTEETTTLTATMRYSGTYSMKEHSLGKDANTMQCSDQWQAHPADPGRRISIDRTKLFFPRSLRPAAICPVISLSQEIDIEVYLLRRSVVPGPRNTSLQSGPSHDRNGASDSSQVGAGP